MSPHVKSIWLVFIACVLSHTLAAQGVGWSYSARIHVSYHAAVKVPHNPVFERMPYPEYPFEMVRAGIGGVVQLQCVIGKDGAVTSAKVTPSSSPTGNAQLDQAALAAVKTWKFAPWRTKMPNGAIANDYTGDVTLNVRIKFELTEE